MAVTPVCSFNNQLGPHSKGLEVTFLNQGCYDSSLYSSQDESSSTCSSFFSMIWNGIVSFFKLLFCCNAPSPFSVSLGSFSADYTDAESGQTVEVSGDRVVVLLTEDSELDFQQQSFVQFIIGDLASKGVQAFLLQAQNQTEQVVLKKLGFIFQENETLPAFGALNLQERP